MSSPVSGSFTLREITFKVVGLPQRDNSLSSLIDIADTIFGNPEANGIPHDVYDGEFYYHYVPDTAIVNAVSGKTIVGKTLHFNASVALANQGYFEEVFQISVYANGTLVALQNIVLVGNASVPASLRCNTSALSYGNYALSVHVTPVFGETEIADNTYPCGTILVTIPGDVNGDGKVNVLDLISIAVHLGHKNGDGHTPQSSDWWKCMNADLTNDGAINVLDLILCANYL